MRPFCSCLISLSLAACGGDPPVATPDLASADPCAPFGASSATGCASAVSFQAGPLLPKARDHHGTAVVEVGGHAYLYVTGGTNYGTIFNDAWFAPIAADGTLGAFTATMSLPGARAGHAVVVRGDRLVLIGGQGFAGQFLSSVVSAQVGADGTLSAWTEEPPLPGGRFHIAAAGSATHVYAVGGVRADGDALPFIATPDVYWAAWQPDGHLRAWQATTLPEPRSHHAAVLHDGTLYLVGGLIQDTSDGSPMAHEILAARLGDDGAPGTFAVVGTFDDPVGTLAAFALNGSIYALGGLTEDDAYDARIRRAPIQPDASLGAFADAGELPEARSHVHQTPLYRGHLYTMGGSVGYQAVTDAVWVGAVGPATGAPKALRRGAPKRGASCPCKVRISIPR